MADAERERIDLNTRIQQLEAYKKDVESKSARKIEENCQLIDQLESLNSTVLGSDLRIRVLEVALQTSKQTIRRLESAACRAADMERHIAAFVKEQKLLQNSLQLTEMELRCAMQRWTKAELGLSDLQSQIERMEKEGKEERQRHAEVLSRMEMQRSVEQELENAATGLQGAKLGTSSISHLTHVVRDLLKDNAKLQLGMAETRDMLLASSEEIQALRDQLLHRQAMAAKETTEASQSGFLDAELESPRANSELHIHHHYHVSNAKTEKKSRIGEKRQRLSPAVLTPLDVACVPPTPSTLTNHRFQQPHETPGPRGRPVRESVSSKLERWSLISQEQSEFTLSSVPSSPQGYNRYSAIFDRAISDTPGSPTTTIEYTSPALTPAQRKRFSEISALSLSSTSALAPVITRRKSLSVHEEEPDLDVAMGSQEPPYPSSEKASDVAMPSTNIERPNRAIQIPNSSLAPEVTLKAASFDPVSTTLPAKHEHFPHRISRTLSYESINSAGGTETRKLFSRPSQLSLRPLGAAIPATTNATAHATIPQGAGTALLRSRMYSTLNRRSGRLLSSSTRSIRPLGDEGHLDPSTSMQSTLSKSPRIRTWAAWRPWVRSTSTPTKCVSASGTPLMLEAPEPDLQFVHSAGSTLEAPTTEVRKSTMKQNENKVWRGTGINQPGAIHGFQEFMTYHNRRSMPQQAVPVRLELDGPKEAPQQ